MLLTVLFKNSSVVSLMVKEQLLIMLPLLVLIKMSLVSADYVPVFTWEINNEKIVQMENRDSLNSFNSTFFESILLKQLKQNKTVVVFLEDTLSQEDFILRYKGGKTVFPNLSNFVTISNILYLPRVKNPYEIIKANAKFEEHTSVSSALKNCNIYKNKLLIIDLKSTENSENRKDMFSRHDSVIFKIQSAFFESRNIIFGVYTGRQSWIVPETSDHFKSKKLLQNDASSSNNTLQNRTFSDLEKPKKVVIDDKSLLLVVSDVEYSKNSGHTFTTISLSQSNFNVADKEINFSLQGGNLTILFSVTMSHQHWTIGQITLNQKNSTYESVGAPMKFSFHCSKLRLENHRTEELLIISGFQIQPFQNGSDKRIFGTAIDCTGFTTIIIWNVIFVLAILLSILSFGIASMMDIKTMDRFEDPQKKPFHVIAED